MFGTFLGFSFCADHCTHIGQSVFKRFFSPFRRRCQSEEYADYGWKGPKKSRGKCQAHCLTWDEAECGESRDRRASAVENPGLVRCGLCGGMRGNVLERRVFP